jgi:flagellar protein FlaG
MDGVTNGGGHLPSVNSPIGQVVRENPASEGENRRKEVAASKETTRASGSVAKLSGEEQQKIVEAVVRAVGEVAGAKTALRFSMADASRGPVIRVVDAKTEEVIREIPPEELIEVARALRELSGESAGPGQPSSTEGVIKSFLVDILA